MGKRNQDEDLEKDSPEYELRHLKWRERLRVLEARWVENNPENSAAWQAQRNELMLCVYAGCMQGAGQYSEDQRSEAVAYVMKDLERFEPERYHLPVNGKETSKLASYLSGCIGRRLKDSYGKEWKRAAGETSIDQPMAEAGDNAVTLRDLLPDTDVQRRYDPVTKEAIYAMVFSLLAQIQNFDTLQHGQRKNDTRRRNYRLCYAEQLSHFVMDGGLPYIANDRMQRFRKEDVLRALEKSYVHYFCEGEPLDQPEPLKALEFSQLKRRGECIARHRDDEERLEWTKGGISGFLEAQVPICYLKQDNIHTSDGEISRYRDAFVEDVKNLMGKQGYDQSVLHDVK